MAATSPLLLNNFSFLVSINSTNLLSGCPAQTPTSCTTLMSFLPDSLSTWWGIFDKTEQFLTSRSWIMDLPVKFVWNKHSFCHQRWWAESDSEQNLHNFIQAIASIYRCGQTMQSFGNLILSWKLLMVTEVEEEEWFDPLDWFVANLEGEDCKSFPVLVLSRVHSQLTTHSYPLDNWSSFSHFVHYLYSTQTEKQFRDCNIGT